MVLTRNLTFSCFYQTDLGRSVSAHDVEQESNVLMPDHTLRIDQICQWQPAL